MLLTAGISFLSASLILMRRVHENRLAGVPGNHSFDAYWPFNVIWNYFFQIIKVIFARIYAIIAPYTGKIIGVAASKMYKVTSSASQQFLQISNLVHGKGSLKKNTGNTSLFLRDISSFKKGSSSAK